jgi:hypothetical protein
LASKPDRQGRHIHRRARPSPSPLRAQRALQHRRRYRWSTPPPDVSRQTPASRHRRLRNVRTPRPYPHEPRRPATRRAQRWRPQHPRPHASLLQRDAARDRSARSDRTIRMSLILRRRQ